MNPMQAIESVRSMLRDGGAVAWDRVAERLRTDADFFAACREGGVFEDAAGRRYRAGRVLTPDSFVPPQDRICIGAEVPDPEAYSSLGGSTSGLRERVERPIFYRLRDVEVQIRRYFPDDHGWQYHLSNGDCLTSNINWLGSIAQMDRERANIAVLDRSAAIGVFRQPDAPPPRVSTPCITLFGRKNYFHFIVDELPTILFSNLIAQTQRLPVVVTKLHPVQQGVCEAFGLRVDRMLPLEQYMKAPDWNSFRFAEAYVPALVPFPERVNILRLATGAAKLPAGSRRIFLRRRASQLAPSRLLNEEELSRRMESEGFEILYAEDHSVPEQKAIFSRAALVVGVHGAGLTNMIFAPRGCLLVEIMNEKSHNNPSRYRECYRRLCDLSGQQYARLVCEVVGEASPDRDQDNDIRVDPDRLLRLVEAQMDALGIR